MENKESNINVKLTSFSQEEATTNLENTNINNNDNKINNIASREIITRPILWGVVVFLVCFAFVIGAVSIYRMYKLDQMSKSQDIMTSQSEVVAPPNPTIDNSPVSTDTIKEANIVESEINSIELDLDGEIYSDESLGL